MENTTHRARAIHGEILNGQAPPPIAAGPAAESSPVLPGLEHHAETAGIPPAAEPTTQKAAQKPEKQGRKNGAQFENRSAEKHRGRGRVVLAKAPPGYGHVYRQVRELLRDLKAEWESKLGTMSLSQQEALSGACHWLVRSRCWHRWARGAERTDAERNQALSNAVECFDRYISRLRSIGLAKTGGKASEGDDAWANLHSNHDSGHQAAQETPQ